MPRDTRQNKAPGSSPAGIIVARSGSTRRTKVKTGCITCSTRSISSSPLTSNRVRKVRCDEAKPFCQKCISTGRTCDGYKSPFRSFAGTNSDQNGAMKTLQLIRPISTMTAPLETELLNRYFSTKTVFNVTLDCSDEANQILLASLSFPPLRHAVSSLKGLRENFETCDEPFSTAVRRTQRYKCGIQQYNKALAGLVSDMSSSNSRVLASALLCCQVFISIEQVQGHYCEMIRHIIRGLGIMRESRARPYFVAPYTLMPAHHNELPLLDVFVIKVFSAPSRFAEPKTIVASSSMRPPATSCTFRTIVPDMRADLTRVAASMLAFLGEVSQVHSVGHAIRLLRERSILLESLDSWLDALELVQTSVSRPGPELISVTFMRLFQLILRIIVLGTLVCSLESHAELQIASARLQDTAILLDRRLETYPFCNEDDGS